MIVNINAAAGRYAGRYGQSRIVFEAWKRKSLEIRERDKYLCQICMRKLYGTTQQYNNREIEVHHIVPIAEDWDGRLDNDNLISLCGRHHEMAEAGKISQAELKEIARQQEDEM